MLNPLKRYAQTVGANFVKSSEVPNLRFVDPVMDDKGKVLQYVVSDNPRTEGKGVEKFLAQTTKFGVDHPLQAVGAVGGTILANNLLGNPIGGTIDAVTGGITNFKADAMPTAAVTPQATVVPPSYQEASHQALSQGVPALSADDLRRQVQYYQRRVRTDLETLKALEQQHYKANALGLE